MSEDDRFGRTYNRKTGRWEAAEKPVSIQPVGDPIGLDEPVPWSPELGPPPENLEELEESWSSSQGAPPRRRKKGRASSRTKTPTSVENLPQQVSELMVEAGHAVGVFDIVAAEYPQVMEIYRKTLSAAGYPTDAFQLSTRLMVTATKLAKENDNGR